MLNLRPQIITSRVLSDLKSRSTIGIAFYIIALLMALFSGGYYQRYPDFSFSFLAQMTAVTLFRLIHMILDRRLPQNRINSWLFFGSVVLTALVWGIGYARFTLQPEDLYTQSLLVTCTIGLCSGGVVAFIPHFWLALLFNICIMVPGIVLHFTVAGNFPLGFLFLLFFLYMVFMAYRQNIEYWTALDNEYLLKQKTDALKELSNQDGLTGLFNRRYFDQTFAHEWKQAVRNKTPIAIMLCDIDHFKKINDVYGHLAGDAYLKELSRILRQVFQRESDIVARYGGEEFVILISEDGIETIRMLGDKLLTLVEKTTLEFENRSIRTTVSIGIAHTIPGVDSEKEDLILQADQALYAAKDQGRNQIQVFDQAQ